MQFMQFYIFSEVFRSPGMAPVSADKEKKAKAAEKQNFDFPAFRNPEHNESNAE